MIRFPLLFILLSFVTLQADNIPDPALYHQCERHVKIVNTDDYPDYVFLGVVDEIMSGGTSIYKITADSPYLTKGYKFNTLYLLAMEDTIYAQYVPDVTPLFTSDTMGGVLLDYAQEHNITHRNALAGGSHFYIENDYPVVEDNRSYVITSIDDAHVNLELKQRRLTFEDGTLKTIDY